MMAETLAVEDVAAATRAAIEAANPHLNGEGVAPEVDNEDVSPRGYGDPTFTGTEPAPVDDQTVSEAGQEPATETEVETAPAGEPVAEVETEDAPATEGAVSEAGQDAPTDVPTEGEEETPAPTGTDAPTTETPTSAPAEQVAAAAVTASAKPLPYDVQMGWRLVKIAPGEFAIADANKVPYNVWDDLNAAKRARRYMAMDKPIDEAAIAAIGHFLRFGPAKFVRRGDPKWKANGKASTATAAPPTTETPPTEEAPAEEEAPTAPLVDLTVPLDVTGEDVDTLLATYEPKNMRPYARKCLAALATDDAPAPAEKVNGLGRGKIARIQNEVALLRDEQVWACRAALKLPLSEVTPAEGE
jgi:hypothetical protein